MNVHRALLALIAFGTLAVSFATVAQVPAAIARVGYISVTPKSVGRSHLEAFTQGLKELGYVEGKTFVIEQRWADGNRDLLPALVACRPYLDQHLPRAWALGWGVPSSSTHRYLPDPRKATRAW